MSVVAALLLVLASALAALDNADQGNGFRAVFHGAMGGFGFGLLILAVNP